MQEVVKLLIGIIVLLLGIPIGDLLARLTKEELKSRKKWFIVIILLCFIGAILGLIFQHDALLFTLLFIAIVTSRSLVSYKIEEKVGNKGKNKRIKSKKKVKKK